MAHEVIYQTHSRELRCVYLGGMGSGKETYNFDI